MTKEEALVELYDLIDFYYENRDLPVPDNFNFFEKVNQCCQVLSVDSKIVIKEFELESM